MFFFKWHLQAAEYLDVLNSKTDRLVFTNESVFDSKKADLTSIQEIIKQTHDLHPLLKTQLNERLKIKIEEIAEGYASYPLPYT